MWASAVSGREESSRVARACGARPAANWAVREGRGRESVPVWPKSGERATVCGGEITGQRCWNSHGRAEGELGHAEAKERERERTYGPKAGKGERREIRFLFFFNFSKAISKCKFNSI